MGQDAKTTKDRKVRAAQAAPTGTGGRSATRPTTVSGDGPIPVNELYLDPKAVGKRLKLSPRTVADMANDGRLPAYRIGIALRFKWADVDQFITANCRVTGN